MSKKEFKPGDKVRHRTVRGVASASDDQWQEATVKYCGTERVFVRYEWDDDGLEIVEEEAWRIRDTELVPVYPELWINVYPNRVTSSGFESLELADRTFAPGRVAVIHLASDGTLTLEPRGVSGDVRGAA